MKNNMLSVYPMSEMTKKPRRGSRHSRPATISATQGSAAASSTAQRWTLCIASLFLIVICVGCGGGGYNPNDVVVSVSPASATVSENGQLAFKATVTGLCQGCQPSLLMWSISEDSDSSCIWVATPPTVPCPGGTVQVTEFEGSLTATYFAPSSSGTFHLVASEFVTPTETKQGTSVVTVTP
jgi:hypothetical protein